MLSDEIHCDLTNPGKEYIPFASASPACRDNSITCIAPTKAFNIAGLQTAAVVVPNENLHHKVWRALNTDEVAEPNAFAVDAAVAAFEKGGEWLDCSKITADAQKLAAYIRRTTGLYVSEGSQFGQGGECFLRVNIACPRSVLKEGMLLLVTGLASYQE